MKKLLIIVSVAALLGLLWNMLFNYRLQPDFRFWNRCADATDAWNAQLRQESDAPCYVFAGGSETRTTTDPQALRELFGLRAVNAAAQGIYGGICNAVYGLSYTRPGDTLVFPLAAYDLSAPPENGGLRFLWHRLGTGMFEGGLIPCRAATLRSLAAGDAASFSVCLLKSLISREPICHFEKDAVVHPSGWMEVRLNEEGARPPHRMGAAAPLYPLSEAWLQGLVRLDAACRARGVRLVLAAHVAHADDSCRAETAMQALSALRCGLSVLRDERLGCEPDGALFAETDNHQNARGTALHMQLIGRALQENALWTEEALQHELRLRGRRADGRSLRSVAP